MHAYTCAHNTHTHTPLSQQWLWFHLATQALGGSPVWLGEAVAWNLPKPQSWHSALILNLPGLNSLSRTKKKKKALGLESRDTGMEIY